MRHTLRETWSGLRRNLSMTIAVTVTIWVSLALFGVGLMTWQEVNAVKGRWYDKIEISVFLCVKDSVKGNCTAGQDATDAQRAAIKTALEANPEVQSVTYESKDEAYADYLQVMKDNGMDAILTRDQMQDAYRVKLKNPEHYSSVVSEVTTMPGVQNVQDLHKVLDKVFGAFRAIQIATMVMSAILLLAAALQIANTIRMAAFARRRELGIMRLVGASNLYILLPFVLESLVAGLLGAALACGTMALGYELVIVRNAKVSLQALHWVPWRTVIVDMVVVAIVAVALSIIPTLLATRKYLRV